MSYIGSQPSPNIAGVSVTPTGVSDQANSSTGYFDLPAGTTAERPGTPASGMIRYNTTTGSIEFHNGSLWISTNLIPVINSVTGTIYAAQSSNLTLSLNNATDTITVRFSESGSTIADVTNVTVTSGSATVSVPAAVYGQTAGDTIALSVINIDGTTSSNSISKTVQGLPTGGTITTSGAYRYHTFTSSSNFVVPSGISLSGAEALVIAGGGAGGFTTNGWSGGGGGSGGAAYHNNLTLSSNTYTVTVGAGGAGPTSNSGMTNDRAPSGSNSSLQTGGSTMIGYGGGGGAGNVSNYVSGANGGSGGGGENSASASSATQGTGGTAHYGSAGGAGQTSSASGGGGGLGEAGNTDHNGAGGDGLNTWSTWASATSTGASGFYGGGGGGGSYNGSTCGGGCGGDGGGGNGGDSNGSSGIAGTANTGGGGGGRGAYNKGSGVGGSGGSGIVIIRYSGSQRGTGGTVVSSGGYTYHTFTSSGTFTA